MGEKTHNFNNYFIVYKMGACCGYSRIPTSERFIEDVIRNLAIREFSFEKIFTNISVYASTVSKKNNHKIDPKKFYKEFIYRYYVHNVENNEYLDYQSKLILPFGYEGGIEYMSYIWAYGFTKLENNKLYTLIKEFPKIMQCVNHEIFNEGTFEDYKKFMTDYITFHIITVTEIIHQHVQDSNGLVGTYNNDYKFKAEFDQLLDMVNVDNVVKFIQFLCNELAKIIQDSYEKEFCSNHINILYNKYDYLNDALELRSEFFRFVEDNNLMKIK